MDPHKLLEVIRPFWLKNGLDLAGFSDEYLAGSLRTLGGRGQTTLQVAEFSDYFITFDAVTARYDGSDIKDELRPKLKQIYADLLSKWDNGTPVELINVGIQSGADIRIGLGWKVFDAVTGDSFF